MERGWFQSKRSSGLKAPSVAALVRVSRFLASRSRRSSATRSSKHCAAEARVLVSSAIIARSASGDDRIPSVRSAAGTSGLGIVGLEVMRDDVAISDVRCEADVERERRRNGTPALLAERRERTWVVHPAGEHLHDGRREELRAVEVEELQRPRGHGSEVAAGVDPALIERVDGGDHRPKPVAALGLAGDLALGDEGGAVLGRFDHLPSAPAARVASDHGGAIEETHLAIVGGEGERLLHVVGWDRVLVDVEPAGGGLVDDDGDHLVRRRERARERQEPRPLVVETLTYGASRERRVLPRVRDLVEEAEELAVSLFDAPDDATSEEPLADEADHALDVALLVGLPRRAELEADGVVAGEIEQQRVEPRCRAVTLENDGLRVIEEPLARRAAEIRARARERAQERPDRQVEHELAPHRARPRQRHDEEPQRAPPARHVDVAHVRPVDLRLLADERGKSQESLVLRGGADLVHVLAERPNRAGVAARL